MSDGHSQGAAATVPRLPLRANARREADVAVVGGGAAGLYTALRAAASGARVLVVSRKPLAASASFWAQGGLAAALAPDDSPARHADDTLNAGRDLCRSEAAEVLTREAPGAVAEPRERGARFDPDPARPDGALSLAP